MDPGRRNKRSRDPDWRPARVPGMQAGIITRTGEPARTPDKSASTESSRTIKAGANKLPGPAGPDVPAGGPARRRVKLVARPAERILK